MEIKAIITDLDRTLLRTDKSVSAYTLSVLTRCRKQGMSILVATARPNRSITTYQQQIGFDAAATLNGAKLLLPTGVVENSISSASASSILQKAVHIPNVVISLEADAGFFSNMHDPVWNPVVWNNFPSLPPCGQIYKLLFSCPTDDLRRMIQSALPEDTYFSIANRTIFQVMDKKATKWSGVQAMLCAIGIAPKHAVYFGDDHDDLEPIKRCGIGVAVSNSISEVLEAADDVAPSNDSDGVARWIEKNLLT